MGEVASKDSRRSGQYVLMNTHWEYPQLKSWNNFFNFVVDKISCLMV